MAQIQNFSDDESFLLLNNVHDTNTSEESLCVYYNKNKKKSVLFIELFFI